MTIEVLQRIKENAIEYREESKKYDEMADYEERKMLKMFLNYFYEQGRKQYGYGIATIDF